MIEAGKIWNEPNNKSHWDPEIDPEWSLFADMAKLTGDAMADKAPGLTRVLGGISPLDPAFIQTLANMGVLDWVVAVAGHGFPLACNLWLIADWPARPHDT